MKFTLPESEDNLFEVTAKPLPEIVCFCGKPATIVHEGENAVMARPCGRCRLPAETRAKYERRATEYSRAAALMRNEIHVSDPQVRATLETMAQELAQELDEQARKWREETDPDL